MSSTLETIVTSNFSLDAEGYMYVMYLDEVMESSCQWEEFAYETAKISA